MTKTIVESSSKTVTIGLDEPFCIIGERINPTGRKKLALELENGNIITEIATGPHGTGMAGLHIFQSLKDFEKKCGFWRKFSKDTSLQNVCRKNRKGTPLQNPKSGLKGGYS